MLLCTSIRVDSGEDVRKMNVKLSTERRDMHRELGEVRTWCMLSFTDAVVSPAIYSTSVSVSYISAEGICVDSRKI